MILFPADYEPMSNVIILRSIVQYCTGDFLAAAAVVVFVVVVNNNEEISYQGHNQIHIHSRLCYIFFSSCCLVLFSHLRFHYNYSSEILYFGKSSHLLHAKDLANKR